MKFLRFVFASLVLFVLAACSSTPDQKTLDPFAGMSAKILFTQGERAMASGGYGVAANYFESLDAQYPFSPYTQQAQLNIIYAYYRSDDKASAVAAADHYIHLYPRSKDVDYAYYMKGIASFEQNRGILSGYVPLDHAWRDPGTATTAYDTFATLIRRFPRSQYALDARQRMVYLRNLFAQKELHIATYYMRRRAYVAAANRATYLIEHYPQAPQAEQALVLLVKANRELGLRKPAEDALATLRLNYPRSTALKKLIG